MKLVFASDHGGFQMKRALMAFAAEKGYEITDVGCYSEEPVDYPDIAVKACGLLTQAEADRVVLICGTGIGMSIAANKLSGVRCALCSDATSARLTREHNDTNALALGGRIIGLELAKDILSTWLGTGFIGSYHANRIKKITDLETGAIE